MGVKVNFNAAQLEASIMNIAKRASGNAARAMRRAAVRIRDLARENAPYKTGDLEKAIEYGVIKGSTNRNVYVVYIDMDMIRSRGDGSVGDYAWIMEEELHPYGRQKGKRYFTLGPGSAAKAATGKKVGGRFLSRAVREGTKGVIGDAVAEVKRTLGSNRIMNVQYQRENEYDGESE